MLLPCGDVVTTIRACLAGVIANVVADVIATFVLILADVVPTIVKIAGLTITVTPPVGEIVEVNIFLRPG